MYDKYIKRYFQCASHFRRYQWYDLGLQKNANWDIASPRTYGKETELVTFEISRAQIIRCLEPFEQTLNKIFTKTLFQLKIIQDLYFRRSMRAYGDVIILKYNKSSYACSLFSVCKCNSPCMFNVDQIHLRTGMQILSLTYQFSFHYTQHIHINFVCAHYFVTNKLVS